MAREPRQGNGRGRFARTFARLAALVGLALATGACRPGSDDFRFVSQPMTQSVLGEAWTYTPVIEGGTRYELRIVSGPPGMTVSQLSGQYSWTPALADLGTHAIVLDVVQEDTGNTDTQSFDLRIHQGLELGVTLSPRGHTGASTPDDFVAHYQDRTRGRLRAFHGNWRGSVATAGVIPEHALAGMAGAASFGYVPAIGIGWADGNGVPDLTSGSSAENSWLNAETRQLFLDMVTQLATDHRPPFLFLGNEINLYYEAHTQTEWDAWVSELEACADAIHAASPQTVVYTTFQLEFLTGLGANAGWAGPARWELVDDVTASGKLDAIGFTTYPYLEYDTLGELPADHWNGILAHTTGPVIFSEVAWPAAAHAPYPGDELDQADFVSTFLDGISGLDVLYAAWLFDHDWDQELTVPAFASTGLRDNLELVPRAADAVWQAEVQRRQAP